MMKNGRPVRKQGFIDPRPNPKNNLQEEMAIFRYGVIKALDDRQGERDKNLLISERS